ncbi:MAG: type I-U CRISPR-associated protein Csb2, partial [Acidobacteria bacterium]|nr:type I-U CRISPR-associated protein Csb2 [Acidobacteriota bacterium]
MIALGVRYLTKYAVATNSAAQRVEWPPHPGRIFMAMAAAHFESGADPAERAALEWLEAASPPALRASDADERTIVRAYVPVNDVHGGIIGRSRQDRAFPRTRPHEDCVYLIWGAAEPTGETRAALERVCAKVTRVGHSMSAVQMWVVGEGEEPAPNWLPDKTASEARLRVTVAGTLRGLEGAFNGEAIQQYDALAEALASAKGKEKTRLKNEVLEKFPDGRPESKRPQLVNWEGYGRSGGGEEEQGVMEGPFDENFVVLTKKEGATLGLESTLQLTGAMRNCAMVAAGATVPEWLSGHDAARAPSLEAHVAFFPLPYVGFEYADGHVLGLGIAVPRTLRLMGGTRRDEELRRVMGPLFFDPESGEERDIRLWKAGVWDWTMEREKRERPPLTLQRPSWTKPSRTWASVTPVVLHHYPKKRDGEIERIVKEAFVSALFPEPEQVTIRSVSAAQGAGHAMAL